jgi:hypothetical protein
MYYFLCINIKSCITNLMGHDLAIVVVWSWFFIGLYGINTNVIHLLVLFEHKYCAHYLNMNVICLFVLFKHRCCMSIHVAYTWKSYTQLSCLNNAWHSCSTNTNLWNNRFWVDLKQTHETPMWCVAIYFEPSLVIVLKKYKCMHVIHHH